MMLQIVSYIDCYSVYTFNIHVPSNWCLTNQNQALVTLCLNAYLNFINCDLYAAYWWPMIGNKLYYIIFCSKPFTFVCRKKQT